MLSSKSSCMQAEHSSDGLTALKEFLMPDSKLLMFLIIFFAVIVVALRARI